MTSSPLAFKQLFIKFVNNNEDSVYIISNELLKYPESKLTKLAENALMMVNDNSIDIEVLVSMNKYALTAVKYFYKNDTWDNPHKHQSKMRIKVNRMIITSILDICKYLNLPKDCDNNVVPIYNCELHYQDHNLIFKFDDLELLCKCH